MDPGSDSSTQKGNPPPYTPTPQQKRSASSPLTGNQRNARQYTSTESHEDHAETMTMTSQLEGVPLITH